MRADLLEDDLSGPLAHDVGDWSRAFAEVAKDFGAEPWFFQQGAIHHINSAIARWEKNSKASVGKADLVVFVILNKYGEITWNTELREALRLGKPFVVMAQESVWLRYQTLMHTITDPGGIKSSDDQKMVDLLRTISSDYELTVVPFSNEAFKETLRSEIARLTAYGLELVEARNMRESLLDSISGGGPLRGDQAEQLKSLAADEYESNKLERKAAIRRLAAQGVRDDEFLQQICNSTEQGV